MPFLARLRKAGTMSNLPYDLATITSTESKENILSKLGGSEGVKKISDAINKGKKIFIESYGVVGKIPVSSLNFIIQSWISYAVPTASCKTGAFKALTDGREAGKSSISSR